MMTNEPTRAKKIFARTCIAICVGIVAFPAIARWVKDRPADYDYEASIAKLKKIGAALQLYRAEYGVKPVAERRNYSDAGLPPVLYYLYLRGNGTPWYVNLEDLRVSHPVASMARMGPLVGHFQQHYTPGEWENGLHMDEWFALRGESLPIMSDFNMNPDEERRGKFMTVLVLRLDGTVDQVTYDRSMSNGILDR